jgi:intracellular sulfur oxidation DsrE/DsrF family protein
MIEYWSRQNGKRYRRFWEVAEMEKYTKDGVDFYTCCNSVTGKKFLVASKSDYDIVVKTEEEAFRIFRRRRL